MKEEIRKERLKALSLQPYEAPYPDLLENLTPLEFRIVELWFSGQYRSLTELVRDAQLPVSPSTVSKILAKDEVQEYWRVCRQMFYQNMSMATMSAGQALQEVVTNKNARDSDKINASKAIFDVMGMKIQNGDEEESNNKIKMGQLVQAIILAAQEKGKKDHFAKNFIKETDDGTEGRNGENNPDLGDL